MLYIKYGGCLFPFWSIMLDLLMNLPSQITFQVKTGDHILRFKYQKIESV